MSAVGDARQPLPASAQQQTTPDPFDQHRQNLYDRMGSWSGPPGSSPEDVAELRAELREVILNAHQIPGQSFEQATADLQDRLDDKLHIFSQDQTIERLVHEEQREAEERAAELAGERHFADFQRSMLVSTEHWVPLTIAGTGIGGSDDPTDISLVDIRARINALVVGMTYDRNKPVELQEQALRAAAIGIMRPYAAEYYKRELEDAHHGFAARIADTATSATIPNWNRQNEINKIIDERDAFDKYVGDELKANGEAFLDRVLPHARYWAPPPDPELVASAARDAEREQIDLDPSSGIDLSQVRTLTDAFDHNPDDSLVDPLHQPNDLGAMGTEMYHPAQTAVDDASAGVMADDDVLGTTAATAQLSDVAANGTSDIADVMMTTTDSPDPMLPDAPTSMVTEHEPVGMVMPDPDPVGADDPVAAMQHDPVLGDHYPGDPVTHEHGVDHGAPEPQYDGGDRVDPATLQYDSSVDPAAVQDDPTNPFEYTDPAASPMDDTSVLVMPDDPLPAEPDPLDDLP